MSGGQIFSPILYGVLDAVEGFCFVGFLGCQRPTWKSCTCGTAQGCIPSLEANAAALLIVRRSLWSLWQSFRFSFNFLCFGVLSRNIIACASMLKYFRHVFSQKFQILQFQIWTLDKFWLTAVQSEEPESSFSLWLENVQCPSAPFFLCVTFSLRSNPLNLCAQVCLG